MFTLRKSLSVIPSYSEPRWANWQLFRRFLRQLAPIGDWRQLGHANCISSQTWVSRLAKMSELAMPIGANWHGPIGMAHIKNECKII